MNPERFGDQLQSSELSSWAKSEGVTSELGYWQRQHEYLSRESWLNKVEEKICGNTQLPSSTFELFSNPSEQKALRTLHLGRFLSGRAEDAGQSLAVYGATTGSIALAELGFGVSAIASIANAYLENRAGSHVATLINEAFVNIAQNKRAKDALVTILDSLGYNRSLLEEAPNNGYMTELAHIWDSMVRSATKPLMIGGAMIAGGNPAGWIVAALGSAGIPIGNVAHKYELKDKRPAQRWAASTAVKTFTETMQNVHLRMVMTLRTVSEIPSLANVYIMSQAGKLGPGAIGTFLGVSTGLDSLSGTLSLQRSRSAQTETVHSLTKFLHFLSSPESPIITPYNAPEHRKNSGVAGIERSFVGMPDGMYLSKFKPMYGTYPEDGISAGFETGTITRITGDSGVGKTNIVEAIAGLFNHTGDIVFVKGGVVENIHEYSDAETKTACISVSRENLAASGIRVYDYFNEFFRLLASRSNSEIEASGPLKEMIALVQSLDPSDRQILLNSSYDQLWNNRMNKYAPKVVKETIIQFLELKKASIDVLLKPYFRLHDITSVSIFSELSAGMKQRVMNAITRAYLGYFDPKALILDEIVEGLDDKNVDFALKDLDAMLRSKKYPPAVLYIAHNRNEMFEDIFGARYQEFEVASGMFVHEKRQRLEQFIFSEHDPVFTYWEIRTLSGGIKQALAFVDLFSGFNPKARDKYLEVVSSYLESTSGLMGEWREYRQYLNDSCGFAPTTIEILQVMATGGEWIVADDSRVNEWAQILVLHSWYALPVFHWLDMDGIGSLFGNMSPGDAIRFHAKAADNWEEIASRRPLKFHGSGPTVWVDRLVVNSLRNYVVKVLNSPEAYWPQYRDMLQKTLNAVGAKRASFVDEWFGFLITQGLRERGTTFIDHFDRLVKNRWNIAEETLPSRELHVFSSMAQAMYASASTEVIV